ncbi:MAG: dipeptide ABC transporter ATP-binding protein [Pseudochelatococcus sp.]|jgi:peptide/nickel transport system ATP-binding protein|uniref:ABC transporter ATP-binding protein n=1 Tax=Pseudochelatococcus sp. TaxID=2020869 RepID=UPI003D90CC4E
MTHTSTPTPNSPSASGSPQSPVLTVEGLNVALRRGETWNAVVRDMNFRIDAGETLAIVGESGSGKSVTSLSIMQLLPRGISRVDGSVRLSGRELLGLSAADMVRIRGSEMAMIFQEPMTSLNPVLSIGEQIAESIRFHRGLNRAAAKAEALKLMDRVRIPDARRRYDDYPYQFSGGMRQRVMIAIALACKPRLLIADEPTTALDVTIQAQVLALIKELQDESGMGVLFVTHDMGVVAEIADRTLVMYRGDQIETGATGDIFARPARPYTRALLSAVPALGSMQGSPLPQPFAIYDSATGEAGATARTAPDTRQPDAPLLLDAQNLVARFNVGKSLLRRAAARVHAVENVSLQVARGETLAIVGESGCGKSTTGRLIAGLQKPVSGRIVLNGENIAGRSQRHISRHVQMVFQDPFASLNPRLTVGKAVAEPVKVHGLAGGRERQEIVADLLRRVGLSPDVARRYPHEFSGGQRQRICIARALALKPGMIVADEAVSALDVSVKAQVVNLLLELQEELRLGLVFISHDMAVVERISHRVAVMYLGEVVEIGSRADVFGNPGHPYTRRLLDAVPIPDPARRHSRRTAAARELASPIRPHDYVPPTREYKEINPGHFVQVPGPEWADESRG